ncbi:MAG: hypothetical protein KBG17_10455 [Paludibacteraceae bacterium]|nr:hypothetical protein [Paludibacteraceae bacterium]
MPNYQIICLANSYKHGGRCIAGIRTDGKGWIRPISNSLHGELNDQDYRLSNGTDLEVLDLVNISLTKPRPSKHQPENWLFEKKPWELIARPAPSDVFKIVRDMVSADSFLLQDTSDRISYKALDSKPAPSSLAIIQPKNLKFRVTDSFSGSKQLRARFDLGNGTFDLVVTDPIWKERLRNKNNGTYSLSDVGIDIKLPIYLTISLGEPLDGYCYKLVAAILQIPLPMIEKKTYSIIEKRKTYPNAYAKWSTDDDIKLSNAFRQGVSQNELAKIFQRNLGAIRCRLIKLGLIER